MKQKKPDAYRLYRMAKRLAGYFAARWTRMVGSCDSMESPPSPNPWGDLDALAAEIGACWPPDTTSVEAVEEVRR